MPPCLIPLQTSDLDVALPDGTGDDAFCGAVAEALTSVLQTFRPDLGECALPATGRQLSSRPGSRPHSV